MRDNWGQGMSTEKYPSWYGGDLDPNPVSGVEGLAGVVALISVHGEDGGMTYEQTEPVFGNHHRNRASAPIPDIVRPA